MKRIIGFLKYRYIAIGLSAAMIIFFSVITIVNGGLNMGIDFAGGVKLIGKFDKSVNEIKIRSTLKDFKPIVQQIGSEEANEYIISAKLSKTNDSKKTDSENIKGILIEKFGKVEFLSTENVGPTIGDLLKKSAVKLFIIALLLMTVYLSFSKPAEQTVAIPPAVPELSLVASQ